MYIFLSRALSLVTDINTIFIIYESINRKMILILENIFIIFFYDPCHIFTCIPIQILIQVRWIIFSDLQIIISINKIAFIEKCL